MREKIKIKLELIKYFFIDSYGWCRSLFVCVFRNIKKPGIFYGYASYFWACKYADKRTRNWQTKWDQSGKQQGVFPLEQTKLITCSKLELKIFKKKKLISKKLKPRKAIKKSYYTTKP
jgi:hypothetical protein